MTWRPCWQNSHGPTCTGEVDCLRHQSFGGRSAHLRNVTAYSSAALSTDVFLPSCRAFVRLLRSHDARLLDAGCRSNLHQAFARPSWRACLGS
jgi:hypothetical protein